MQSNRYGLTKSIEKLHYNPSTQELIAVPHGGGRSIKETVPPNRLSEYVGADVANKLLNQVPARVITTEEYDKLAGTQSARFAGKYTPWYVVDENNLMLDRFATKEQAEQFASSRFRTLQGQNLEMGGAGLKKVYDYDLPNVANKLGKQHGAKVEPINLSYRESTGYAPDPNIPHDPDDIIETRPWVQGFRDRSMQVQSIPITPSMRSKLTSEGIQIPSIFPVPPPPHLLESKSKDKDKK